MTWSPGLSHTERSQIFDHLAVQPAIPALRRVEEVDVAVRHGAKAVFFLTGSLFELREVCARCESLGVFAFCHVDLLHGIGKDSCGVRWLATEIGVRGILTTRSTLIRAAKAEGLMAIQRLFLLDSESLKTGLEVVSASQPDAVEILPALVLPRMAHRLPIDRLQPFIAGGMVQTLDDLTAVTAAGALGVSTSCQDLWGYRRA